MSDFHQAWKEHGPDALERMALERPAEFCKCAAGLIPKDFHIQQNAAEQPQMQIFIREGPLAERFRKAGNEITTLPHRPESTE